MFLTALFCSLLWSSESTAIICLNSLQWQNILMKIFLFCEAENEALNITQISGFQFVKLSVFTLMEIEIRLKGSFYQGLICRLISLWLWCNLHSRVRS
jgi:hypothetical protein